MASDLMFKPQTCAYTHSYASPSLLNARSRLPSYRINPGDEIKASVAAYNKTSGQAVIENLTTGKTVTKELKSSTPLCEQDVEWIVEAVDQDGSRVPLANFGRIEFTNAIATDSSGRSYTPHGATLVDIKQNNTVLTSVAASGDTLTILYV